MATAHINRIATAVPEYDIHRPFIALADSMIADDGVRSVFRRMVRLCGIEHRYSFVHPVADGNGNWGDEDGMYVRGNFPHTAQRMEAFERFAPRLARCALARLNLAEQERRSITHVIVTSCTGLYAPGLDFEVVEHLQLDPSVERTMIGFMGCYAAINALKTAHHIVRSVEGACVLILSLELCSLHMQETDRLEQLLSFLLFADGCAAYLVSARPTGLAIDSFAALTIPATGNLITWRIRELGFDMQLSGRVPGEIRRTLGQSGRQITRGQDPNSIGLWAVHPGGRSVLDAVEQGLGLSPDALCFSRDILARFGNMSSASVMFVLEQALRHARAGQQGCAMSFGPGVTAETMLFHAV